MIDQCVYLLPGRGNRLTGIGDTLASLGFDVEGRELVAPFSRLAFAEQLRVVQNDVTNRHWSVEAKLVGHSYGGYLLLHALSELTSFPGSILLLSPVLGTALDEHSLFMSRPPRADRLLELVEQSRYPAPRSLMIHTGAQDAGCDPGLALRIGSLLPGTMVNVLPGEGHALSPVLVNRAVSEFLRG